MDLKFNILRLATPYCAVYELVELSTEGMDHWSNNAFLKYYILHSVLEI